MSTRCIRPVLVGAACAACAACGAVPDLDKAGAPGAPTELTITNNDSGGSTQVVPAVARFVERLSEVSDGRLVARIAFADWATDGREVDTVAAGHADLGWVGTRAFDLLGVDEFRPLHAPLLIDSYALQAAVVTDAVSTTMLAGIEELGVTPLALLADELLFPASVSEPLVDPAAWDDAGVWQLESDAYADAVSALGGRPLHTFATGGDIREMLQTGEADGLATMWIYYSFGADYQHAPYAVPNVSLGPRTVALFANPDSIDALDDDQRMWLEQAAADAAEWAAAHADASVPSEIDDACRNGARVALASSRQLADLRAVAAPYHQRLGDDPTTGPIFHRIETLKTTTEAEAAPTIPAWCMDDGTAPATDVAGPPLDGPGPAGNFPLGTYRYSLDADHIVQGQELAGRPEMAGTFTWTFIEGEWRFAVDPSDPRVARFECYGWFGVDDDTVTFRHHPTETVPEVYHCTPIQFQARWTTDGGDLVWEPPPYAPMVPHFTETWRRIG